MKFVFHIILSLPELSTGQGGPDVLSCPAAHQDRQLQDGRTGQKKLSCAQLCLEMLFLYLVKSEDILDGIEMCRKLF
jgi:hypothetical protein